ncbi:glycosyltransferase involved in cell wall biosynthesis [Pseudarthrobacter enclensis]|uniref:D-inositol 3-phosphate glycosyltransferase n=1 Tax=Pseudarthrobacter enclensis TaxID=993070 RepID=A0ABT9RX45_9MICC|nr:glycosyltransferase involved in cell wall biosynthesis [Pseudarthrobacter enclensis]
MLELLRKWPKGHRLILVGSGDLEDEVRSFASDDVILMGAVSRGQLLTLMQDAVGVVFPSRCFEGFPLVYPEALSAGTPILTWEPNVVSRLVSSELTGLVGGLEDIGNLLDHAYEFFPRIRAHCRTVYEEKYTEKKWIPALGTVYQSIL